MKIAGIIAEYNPFHNGHAYHIEETRKQTGCDYIIAVISGDFVQRGAPASSDKYIRTRTALLGGADLVLELPVCAAVSSAETFARTGVRLLDSLNCVNFLSFGCETDRKELLSSLARLFAQEPPAFSRGLSSYLKQGYSFPAARAKAAADHLRSEECLDLLSRPNNILAIEYLKALETSSLSPCFIRRRGQDYHSTNTGKGFCSATALRREIRAGGDLSRLFARQMPPACACALLKWAEYFSFLEENDFSSLLQYKLLLSFGHYEDFTDGNRTFANRLARLWESCTSFDSFCSICKSKERTYTAVSRCMIRILLDIREKEMDLLKELHWAPYARILGFRRSAAPLLDVLKGSSIPVIRKLSSDCRDLTESQKALLDLDIRSAHIYNGVLSRKSGLSVKNEFRQPLVYL
ncbi:MAG TPA: nucleotidyltransferase family protein [Candidatus Eubacterium avistercoris]|uniref:tRNA(Met) cytidine acetate ligase n=1 Tax=Candidatus Eubacterium avistercoris TaxID=2838567 RepID=A0A9D2IGW9_9FIRM|nr:nucleotidyltransferase family protein [Candidatus Eubacterium avistercoris]